MGVTKEETDEAWLMIALVAALVGFGALVWGTYTLGSCVVDYIQAYMESLKYL